MLKEMSLACRALSDPTRLRIVKLLAVAELPVCGLMFLLAAGQSRVSQNLATLKHADLVTDVRRGRLVYYSLNRLRFERIIADLQSLIGNADVDDIPDMRAGRRVYLDALFVSNVGCISHLDLYDIRKEPIC